MRFNNKPLHKKGIRKSSSNSGRGRKPRPAIEFPKPTSLTWKEPTTFHEALALHMARHGDTAGHLHKAITGPEDRIDRKTIAQWAAGTKTPRTVTSLEMLSRIERRYQLPSGYFRVKAGLLASSGQRLTIHDLGAIQRFAEGSAN